MYSEGRKYKTFTSHEQEEDWWGSYPPLSLQFLIDRRKEDQSGEVLTVVSGDLSKKGKFGHKNAYPRRFTIKRVFVRQIPIPRREHGYNQFDSTVIHSPTELCTFMRRTMKHNARGWNNPAAFRKALKRAVIDFQKEKPGAVQPYGVFWLHSGQAGALVIKGRGIALCH